MPDDDFQVIQQIRGGDVDAFAILLQRHREHVFRIVAGHVPADQVEEVAHDVFVQAYQSLDGYRPQHPFPHWLARIAVRRCHDYWRRHYRHAKRTVHSLADDAQGWFDAVASELAHDRHSRGEARLAARETLAWALDHLSPEDRMAVTLVHLEERSVATAADLLGWSVANVKVRLFRARHKLRTLIHSQLTSETTP